MENESEGWGKWVWRMRVRDGVVGVENESEGWGKGEWRMRVRDGGVENE